MYEEEEEDEKDDDQKCRDCRSAGNVDIFEAKVLRVAGQNLALAAYLIPPLHLMAHQEYTPPAKSWNLATSQCAGRSSDKAADTSVGNQSASGGIGRKRQASRGGLDQDTGELDEDRNEDEEGEENRYPKRAKSASANDVEMKLRLACPFNKWKPKKYNMHHNASQRGNPKFRACHGPGFANISRLK